MMDIDPPTGYEKTKKQQNDKKTKIHPVSFFRHLRLTIVMIKLYLSYSSYYYYD